TVRTHAVGEAVTAEDRDEGEDEGAAHHPCLAASGATRGPASGRRRSAIASSASQASRARPSGHWKRFIRALAAAVAKRRPPLPSRCCSYSASSGRGSA